MAETTTINTKVEAIRRFFADSKAENHPIKEHPISAMEEYVRDLYLDMLCVVAQYECRDTENGFTLIRRIMAACAGTQPLAEYIKHSMEITSERTAEFIKQCKDNRLCEIFMIDSILLSCANGTPNSKQVGFIAQFGDMLGFDKNNMAEITKFAFAILEQDSKKYQEFLNDNNEALQLNALCYTREFVSGLIVCTSRKRYYYSKNLAEYNVPHDDKNEENFVISELDEIKFENLTISNMEYLNLQMIKNIIFESCHCMRGPLKLTSVDKIFINNCVFKWQGECNKSDDDILNRAIEADLQNFQMTVTNTSFSGYKVQGDYYNKNYYYSSGAVFYNKKRNGAHDKYFLFDNCDFSDIHTAGYETRSYGKNWNQGYYTIVYDDSRVNVTNCHFSNCTCDNSSKKLFYSINEESNNVLVNSNSLS